MAETLIALESVTLLPQLRALFEPGSGRVRLAPARESIFFVTGWRHPWQAATASPDAQ